MKSAFRFIVFLLVVTGWTLAALSLHVVRVPDGVGFILVPKETFGTTDTYVDTRRWTLEDVPQHPLLMHKLQELDKLAALKHVVSPDSRGTPESQLQGAMQRIPVADQDSATRPATASSMLHGLFGMF